MHPEVSHTVAQMGAFSTMSNAADGRLRFVQNSIHSIKPPSVGRKGGLRPQRQG